MYVSVVTGQLKHCTCSSPAPTFLQYFVGRKPDRATGGGASLGTREADRRESCPASNLSFYLMLFSTKNQAQIKGSDSHNVLNNRIASLIQHQGFKQVTVTHFKSDIKSMFQDGRLQQGRDCDFKQNEKHKKNYSFLVFIQADVAQ